MLVVNVVFLVSTLVCGITGSLFTSRAIATLLPKVLVAMSSCVPDDNRKISPEFCIQQWDGKHDTLDPQFEGCKDVMSCALKKLGYMNEDGTWVYTKAGELKESIKDEDLKLHFDDLYVKCKTAGGKNGEAAMNMMNCLISHSNTIKNHMSTLADSVKKHDFLSSS